MASVTREGGSVSEEAFMNEVINVFHPDYRDDSKAHKLKNVKRARRGNFQMSQVLEEAIELRSEEIREIPLKNVDLDGMDFDDGSDLKSCSLSYKKNGTYPLSDGTKRPSYAVKGTIGGMKNKKGDIRVVVWNDILKQVEFYFIPAKEIPGLSTYKDSIAITASLQTGVIEKLAPFRCEDFDALVMC